MLAQNFKTAADLGISDRELDALIKVLGMLEREEIDEAHFNMGIVGEPDCGTSGCLLGWTRVADKDVFFTLVCKACLFPKNEGLETLFYSGEAFDAAPSQGAAALRSYLTTGEANWAEALR